MKIAIVGPAHPYKGGIPQHTTELAHHLRAAGHKVKILSWRNMYPFFYPGEQFVPHDKPELPVFESTERVLSWRNPLGWQKYAKSLRNYDEVIFIWWVPTIQGPVYSRMLKALGEKGPHSLILCHNVVRHGGGALDKKFAARVFNRADRVLVHTKALANEVDAMTTGTPISIAAMPSHLPGGEPVTKPKHDELRKHLLFFGLVRQYKGVDVLLKAIAKNPGISLTVAGELWGKQATKLQELVEELKIADRVTITGNYVDADEIAGLFAASDALVMPYRSGTASQNVDLAFAHGIPVIATAVGSMPLQVHDGVDGLICKPDDVGSLTKAIKHFYEPGVAAKLVKNIPPSRSEDDWERYVDTIVSWPPKH